MRQSPSELKKKKSSKADFSQVQFFFKSLVTIFLINILNIYTTESPTLQFYSVHIEQ